MSYDLWFRSETPLTVDAMCEYFSVRPNFEVSTARAHYENEATGVYFGFDFGGVTDGPEEGHAPVAFNINYFRPHVFGLEAEPVLTAFVDAFQLRVEDPQMEGMADGGYSPEGFLRGWNAGNVFGYRACLPDTSPLTLPSAQIESIWRWNFANPLTVEHMMDLIDTAPPCFVPRVMFFQTGERAVSSLVVWDTRMAIAIPEVDLVLTMTDAGPLVAPASEVLPMLDVHSAWQPDYEVAPRRPVGLSTRLVDEVSPEHSRKIQSLMRPFQPVARLSVDQILDAELVAAARR